MLGDATAGSAPVLTDASADLCSQEGVVVAVAAVSAGFRASTTPSGAAPTPFCLAPGSAGDARDGFANALAVVCSAPGSAGDAPLLLGIEALSLLNAPLETAPRAAQRGLLCPVLCGLLSLQLWLRPAPASGRAPRLAAPRLRRSARRLSLGGRAGAMASPTHSPPSARRLTRRVTRRCYSGSRRSRCSTRCRCSTAPRAVQRGLCPALCELLRLISTSASLLAADRCSRAPRSAQHGL